MSDSLFTLPDGAGYDIFTSVFSPEGRIYQIEYAQKAVDNSETAIGMRGKDGVVFAVLNPVASKLYEPGTNSRIHTVDQHIGIAVAGFQPDARNIVRAAKEAAAYYRNQYDVPSIEWVKDKISMYMHAYTLYSAFRPFGASILMGAYESGEPKLYCIDPSGAPLGYFGCAIGKTKQAAMAEIGLIDLNIPIAQLVKEAAKVMYTIKEDDTEFELEMSWVGERTGGKHMLVPRRVRRDAEEYALAALNEALQYQEEDSI